MTERASATNRPPMMMTTNSVLVTTARHPSAMPRASEPVSPMKMSAGCELNQRKPMQAPASAPANRAGSSTPARKAMAAMTSMTTMTVPAAKPSSPSVRFTALQSPTSRMRQ